MKNSTLATALKLAAQVLPAENYNDIVDSLMKGESPPIWEMTEFDTVKSVVRAIHDYLEFKGE